MPSWSIHRKWTSRLGIPRDLAREVDRLIDLEGLHDKGRRIRSMNLAPGVGVALEPGPTHLLRLIRERFPRSEGLALKAAVLHHLLDFLEGQIKSIGYAIAERMDPEGLVAMAHAGLEQKLRIDYLRYFEGPDNSLDLFLEQLSSIGSELKPVAAELISDILREVKSKSEPIGPSSVTKLISSISTGGIVNVDGRDLPILAASKYLLSRLRRGQRVRLSIRTHRGVVSAELNDLEDLTSFLIRYTLNK